MNPTTPPSTSPDTEGAPPSRGVPPLLERAALVRYHHQGEMHTMHISEPARTVTSLGLQATWRWQPEGDGYRMWVRLTNRGDRTFYLDTIDVLVARIPDLGTSPQGWSIYQNGWASWTPTFARHVDSSLYTDPGTPDYRWMHQPHWTPENERIISSEWGTVIASRKSEAPEGWAVLLGFVTTKDQLTEIRVRKDGSEVIARCYLDNALLPPRGSLGSEVLVLHASQDPLALLETWAETMGQEMEARAPQYPPTGWCSWYYFYGKNTAEDVLANLEAIDRYALPLDVILIDDGYQTAIGDWFSLDPLKFPDGMEPVAQAVQEAGHTLGIWTAPFGAGVDSQLFATRPDWFLKGASEEPVLGWTHWETDCYALDCTHPEVRAWLAETFRRMREEWGVTFFKVDFLFAAAHPGQRYDPSATRAQALRRGLETIREAIGEDCFLLGCGAPLGPCIGLVDGMRVGPDVDPNWRPVWKHDLSMPSTESGLRNSIARAPFHNRLWVNDPDCLLVRQRGEGMDLVLNEMRTLSALVALLGGSTFDSDHLPEIRPGRLKYLRQTLPPTGVSAQPLDLFENEMPRLLLLPVQRDWGRWWVAGVINWDDRTTETTIRLEELGLPPRRYHVYHYWRRRYLGITDDEVTIRRHQPHETAVLLLKPVSDQPDLLTTTFHVCQGAVEIAKVRRIPSAGGSRLKIKVTLVKRGQQFGQVLFSVPQGWHIIDLQVDEVQRAPVPIAPGIVSVGLTLEEQAQIEVKFGR